MVGFPVVGRKGRGTLLSSSTLTHLVNFFDPNMDRLLGPIHYWIPRRWYISKEEHIVTPPWLPDYQLRLYRNSPALLTLPSCIHEALKVKGKSEKIDAFHIKHWDLVVHSRKERENKVSYYEKLSPGNACGSFYLYEDNPNIDVFKDNAMRKQTVAKTGSPADSGPCFCGGFLKKLRALFPQKFPASPKSGESYILSNIPKMQKIGLPYAVEISAHFGDVREAETAYKNDKIFFSYHWFNEDKTILRWDNDRERIPMNHFKNIYCILTIIPPSQAGTYYLQIDIVEEGVKWYAQSGDINSAMIGVLVA
jgi:hypothetical protein